MKDGQSQSRRHRGSSPPFQEHEQAYHDWMKSMAPAAEESDSASDTHTHKQKRYQEGTSNGRIPNTQLSANTEQTSLAEAAVLQDKDDERRWQDDGGESG